MREGGAGGGGGGGGPSVRLFSSLSEDAGTHEMAIMITGSSAMKSEQSIVRHGLRTISRARGAVIWYEIPLGVSESVTITLANVVRWITILE